MHSLHGVHILLAGGDRREAEIYRVWSSAGAEVKLYGFTGCPELAPAAHATEADLGKTAVLIFPVSGVRGDGTVLSPGGRLAVGPLLAQLSANLLVLAGSAASPWREMLQGRGRLVETAEDDELALRNAVPTAEGAIEKAMALSDITVHGSRALVLGMGRCGLVLARTLHGLGASVTVLVRRRESRALAYTMGLEAVFETDLRRAAQESDFIFNTVPALILDGKILEVMRPETLILDLAASPGGIDFAAAERLGLQAHLLPGLPGLAAPRTSGRMQAGVYEKLIRLHCTKV